MKTTIIEILNKIANGEEPPKKIKYHDYIFIYQENHYDYKGENGVWLFDSYVISAILNDEVEILETTITYNQDGIEKVGSIINQTIRKVIPIDELINEQDKIEKLKIITKKTECGHNHHYLVNDNREYRLREVDKIILDKINEIIDRWNNDNRRNL